MQMPDAFIFSSSGLSRVFWLVMVLLILLLLCIWLLFLILLGEKKIICPLLCHSYSFRISRYWQVEFKVKRNKYKMSKSVKKEFTVFFSFLFFFSQCFYKIHCHNTQWNLDKYQLIMTTVSYQLWVHFITHTILNICSISYEVNRWRKMNFT